MGGYRCDAEDMNVGKDAKAPTLGRLAAADPGYRKMLRKKHPQASYAEIVR